VRRRFPSFFTPDPSFGGPAFGLQFINADTRYRTNLRRSVTFPANGSGASPSKWNERCCLDSHAGSAPLPASMQGSTRKEAAAGQVEVGMAGAPPSSPGNLPRPSLFPQRRSGGRGFIMPPRHGAGSADPQISATWLSTRGPGTFAEAEQLRRIVTEGPPPPDGWRNSGDRVFAGRKPVARRSCVFATPFALIRTISRPPATWRAPCGTRLPGPGLLPILALPPIRNPNACHSTAISPTGWARWGDLDSSMGPRPAGRRLIQEYRPHAFGPILAERGDRSALMP